MSSTTFTEQKSCTDATTERKTVAGSLICRATLAYSKEECSRDIEIRVRALHVQLSEQARGQTSKCGNTGIPNCVVTIVKPIQVDRQPPPSVAGSSTSTISSLDTEPDRIPSMKLRRTCSIVGLQSLENLDTIQQETTQQDQDITVYGEDGWGYFDDLTENVSSEQFQSKSFYAIFIAFFLRPRSIFNDGI